MLCGLFKKDGMGCCDAVEDDHVPTVLERERYCLAGGEGCPILAAFRLKGERLNMLDYLNTWSEPPSEAERAAL